MGFIQLDAKVILSATAVSCAELQYLQLGKSQDGCLQHAQCRISLASVMLGVHGCKHVHAVTLPVVSGRLCNYLTTVERRDAELPFAC